MEKAPQFNYKEAQFKVHFRQREKFSMHSCVVRGGLYVDASSEQDFMLSFTIDCFDVVYVF